RPGGQQSGDLVLVEPAAGEDGHAGEAGGVEPLPGQPGQGGDVAGVEPDPGQAPAAGFRGVGGQLLGHHDGVVDPAGGVPGVDEEDGIAAVVLGEGPEGAELAGRIVAGQRGEEGVGHRPAGRQPVADGGGHVGGGGEPGDGRPPGGG